MNPGLLDRKIYILRKSPVFFLTDSIGNQLTTASGDEIVGLGSHATGDTTSIPSVKGRFGTELNIFSLWKMRRARKIEKLGGESTESGRKIGEQRVVWRFRYPGRLKLTDRIQHDGLIYEIINPIEIGRRYMMDVECVLHANTRPEGQDAY